MSKENHPDFESLFRYAEGSMPEQQRAAIEDHLQKCDACRVEVFRIRHVHSETDVPVPPVSDLEARLAQWNSSVAQPDSGEALKHRVEVELIPYVGVTAACQILKRVASSGADLLGVLDSALRPMLGKSAASLLISRIVDRAVMRT